MCCRKFNVHPWPMPKGNQAEWTVTEWQQAANHYRYEIMGIDRSESNYRPYLSMLESAFDHAQRHVRKMRSAILSVDTQK